jgi:hypothetical protein
MFSSLSTTPRSSILQNYIDGQAVKPSRKAAVSAEARELFPRPHEHVLRQRFSVLRVSAHAQAERMNTAHMGPVNTLERAGIAGLRPAYHFTHEIDRIIHSSVDRRHCHQFHILSVGNVVLSSYLEMPEGGRLLESRSVAFPNSVVGHTSSADSTGRT